MIEKIHEHMVQELQQNTKTDTIFIVVAVLLDFILLAVNSSIASEGSADTTKTILITIFIILSIIVNTCVVFGLFRGRQNRKLILEGLISMYRDKGVEKYYSSKLLKNYDTRYYVFSIVIVVLGIVSIAVPLVIRM